MMQADIGNFPASNRQHLIIDVKSLDFVVVAEEDEVSTSSASDVEERPSRGALVALDQAMKLLGLAFIVLALGSVKEIVEAGCLGEHRQSSHQEDGCCPAA
jgi:hypothetical protein